MPLAMLIGQLEKIGRMLNRWGAEIRLTAGLSILLSVLAGLALTDIMLGYGRTGRAVAWGILVVLAGILAERVARALTRRQTPESVAVSVERAFPQLDNHLINFLQFSAAPGGDPFKLAYVSMEVPHWGGLDFRAMKDRRTHQRARMALGVAGVVLFLPWPLVGPAWPVAVWRIANPFSAVAPVSLTHILEVTPGTTSIAQGQDIALSCRVEGKRGHDVLLDLKPADGLSKTVNLGPLKGGGAEAFSHTLTKVTTAVRYRFRAGDAFAPDWYTISLRPPLAFTSITLAVTPPGYMGFRPRHYDIHSASIEIPAGSSVSIQAQANAPLSGVSLSGAGDMAEVIPVLKGVPSVKDESERAKQVVRALSLEEKILRQLTFAEAAAEQAKVESRNSALTGLLDGMIVRQDKIIKATVRCSTQTVAAASALTDDQDALGSDVAAFVKACQAEAAQVKGDDKDFAAFLEGVASFCETQKIREDMLLAAEQLEKKALDEALRHERSGYDKLLAARRKFDEMKATADKEMNQEMIEALQNATEKLEKLKALEKKLIAEMDAVEQNRDKSGKQTDKMEEDYKEIEKNIKEAMLQVPKDLDIFAHLNVGNDIVEDAYSVFEEVTQKEGSEKATDGPVKEKAYMKREMLLDGMEKVEKRLDDFESWLKNEPDGIKQTTESFDKEEMPEGVALTPLQTEMDDIIGDLMKTDKKKDEQDNDGAINSAMPDMEMGGPVTEGNMTTFSAKGRSGNETPDHKEQDGRSNVGRQGMANGETAAGSGTIGKGDDNIEARRTTDPTQAGQVNADGDAKTKATGGGKQGSGKGDGFGMGQGSTRMDSTEAGSMEGLMQMMAKRADSAYAKASMKGLRTDSLKTAAHHIRQAADAVSTGVPIGQVAELKRRAAAELRKAKTELGEGAGASLGGQGAGTTVHDVVESSPDEAPPKYRGLVSEYYKKLGDSL